MGVEMQRKFSDLLQRGDEIEDIVRRNDPSHVLDTNAVGAHPFEGFTFCYKIFEIEHIAAEAGLGQGVTNRTLEVFPIGLDPLHAGLEISEIVQGVENPEDVDPDFARFVHEGPDDVVCIVAVTYQILPPEQHGERGLFDELLEGFWSFPGIFTEEAVHRVKSRSPPNFHRPKAHLIHLFGDGEHVLSAHSGRVDGLVSIAQCIILDLNGIDRSILHNVYHFSFFSFLVHR